MPCLRVFRKLTDTQLFQIPSPLVPTIGKLQLPSSCSSQCCIGVWWSENHHGNYPWCDLHQTNQKNVIPKFMVIMHKHKYHNLSYRSCVQLSAWFSKTGEKSHYGFKYHRKKWRQCIKCSIEIKFHALARTWSIDIPYSWIIAVCWVA